MHIKKITERNRRDFWCIYQCEHCNVEISGTGYDDHNFHHNVIPEMTCGKCGKHADSNSNEIATKYHANQQV